MKRYLLLVSLAIIQFAAKAQTTPGPVEKELTEKICNCLLKLDMSKVTTKEQATAAYTDCVMQNADLLMGLAEERHVEMSDQAAMSAIGVDIAKSLLKQKCEGFTKISSLMAQQIAQEKMDARASINTTTGTFKRVDTKGFNYIVLTDGAGEKSFLWLKQFPGSENFMSTPTKAVGKKIKISWKDLEVYLPQAKGYYNVKEITAIDIL